MKNGATLMALALALSACGGSDPAGADDGARVTSADEPKRAAPTQPTPPPTPAGCSDHSCLTWTGPATCVACHETAARAVFHSQHYQWKGASPLNVNGAPGQGKANGLNSYCVAVGDANFQQCNGCHVGRGTAPAAAESRAELENVDCLLCHQKEYRRVKVNGTFVPDTAAMRISMDEAVRTVHRPTRANCLQCHAKAGGGDAYKRGDLTLAHATTGDRSFDVHMATNGANLACQACHKTSEHRIAGAGTDLRASDSSVRIGCADCHAARATPTGHPGGELGRHVTRVACQTCHIPRYARNASDTAATEATEVHRTWLQSEIVGGIRHPLVTLANDLKPRYAFWNGKQDTILLGDASRRDPVTGNYPTSRPVGSIADAGSKLYPFKYKTAQQPMATALSMLTPMDMATFRGTGDAQAAARQGVAALGLDPATQVEFVTTDTFQLLTHEVAAKSQALGACTSCHGASATQMDLRSLGYVLKGAQSAVCTQCHGAKRSPGWQAVHDKHGRYDCSLCHAFSRPERGLKTSR
jgi:predicted CXXCH cytochrome family protein